MHPVFIVLIGLVLATALAQLSWIRYFGWISERLVAKAQALSADPDNPARSVLIIGDSLWAGVGAKDPDDSLAGRLIDDLPQAQVVNMAKSGAQVADGIRQLKRARQKQEQFDQIIIQLGANDILYLSSLSQARQDLAELLELAQKTAPDVAYMISGSIGHAPVFFQPLDGFYTWMTRRYLRQLSQVSRDAGVLYIDLYRPREVDPFIADPEKYYAADRFHPSGAGYGLWYEKCRQELQCFKYDEVPPENPTDGHDQ